MGRKSDLQNYSERLLEINKTLAYENKDLRKLVHSKNVKHINYVRSSLLVILVTNIIYIGILVWKGIL